MKNKAIENFKSGYSCSEAIVKAAADSGLVSHDLIPIATPFSGGISSGCLCGAVAGMQLVIGALQGRQDTTTSPNEAKTSAKLAMDKFKENASNAREQVAAEKKRSQQEAHDLRCAETLEH